MRAVVRGLIPLVLLASVAALVAVAAGGDLKPFAEGQAGMVGSAAGPEALQRPRGAEGGAGLTGVVPETQPRAYAEGQAGPTGQRILDGAALKTPDVLLPRLHFSGVTDDGAKGASTRREATSILCTNSGNANAAIEVQLFQWSGSLVYTGTVTAPPRASFTFSTQNTTIYFDDVIFGTGGGTDPIFQGYGRVLSDRAGVVCTAEVLDPLGYPPTFVSSLEMYQP